MRKLIVILAVVCLPACTRYLHDDYARVRRPCDRAGMAREVGVIGLSLARTARGGSLEVDRVAPGGPAALADIRPGDRLLAIDGEPTRDLSLHEAARLVRGPVDTAVELRVRSPRGPRLITLVRVPPAGVWENRAAPCKHRRRCDREKRGAPCEHRRHCDRMEHADEDEPAAQPWPPSKPGHRVP